MTLIDEATDPNQYDTGAKNWSLEGSLESPERQFIWSYLDPVLKDIEDLSVLDVGCGTGWLSWYLYERGAKQVVGIEPSVSNTKRAGQLYPRLELFRGTFQDFDSEGRKFDLIIWVLSTEHVADLKAAFIKMKNLINTHGRVIIIAADKDKFLRPRFDYKLRIEHINDDETVVKTIRPKSIDIVDIVRPVSFFRSTAESAGFKFVSTTTMKATEDYLAAKPWLQAVKDEPYFHLMIFR